MGSDLAFTSTPFGSEDSIPTQYTCEGEDVSPALEWTDVPDNADTLTLIVDDPDAPGQTFTHWVLFNVPGNATSLPGDLEVDAEFAHADPVPREGANDFGDAGYGGPCPPPGDGPHRYFFRLYALDTTLDLEQGTTKDRVIEAMNDHVVAETTLMGTYQR